MTSRATIETQGFRGRKYVPDAENTDIQEIIVLSIVILMLC